MARKRPSPVPSPESRSPVAPSPAKRCSPRYPKSPGKIGNGVPSNLPKSPRRRLFDNPPSKPKWNPRDPLHVKAAKEALHTSSVPGTIVCREEEQQKVMEFCKACIAEEKAGSMYVCGCPGTGKTLSIERVKDRLLIWAKEEGFQLPKVLTVNCTTLSKTSAIISKILERCRPNKKNGGGMMLLIVDEMDYLITKDGAVLHELFMLTTFPSSRLVLIGIANAIDLADRFLPRLEPLNCKPKVVTFRAYTKEEIIKILQERLAVLGYDVFQPIALEFCARKVAASSGDIRRALGACLSAIEQLEAEMTDSNMKQVVDVITFEHMDVALSKAFRSPVVDTIQSLPQHQQIVLCSLVKMLTKKTLITIGELNRYYMDTCRSVQVPPAGMLEFSNMCQVLSDQGLLKVAQSRQEKSKRVTLLIDSADVVFALKAIRFFRNCLE